MHREDYRCRVEREVTHDFRFRMGAAFPADSPLARFIVAVAQAMNDTSLANELFVEADRDFTSTYFFNLASSHLYEAAETFRQAHKEWEEIRDFVASLEEEHQEDFARIMALADPDSPWPGKRLNELRNSFFHYLRLDRAATEAGRLPLQRSLAEVADEEGRVIVEDGGPLNGIRALFADEVLVVTVALDWEDGEVESLIGSFAEYQAALSRFAQGALGRYLRSLPVEVVTDAIDPPE
jgi:hypothetical protein